MSDFLNSLEEGMGTWAFRNRVKTIVAKTETKISFVVFRIVKIEIKRVYDAKAQRL